jgi:hypothetical protein
MFRSEWGGASAVEKPCSDSSLGGRWRCVHTILLLKASSLRYAPALLELLSGETLDQGIPIQQWWHSWHRSPSRGHCFWEQLPDGGARRSTRGYAELYLEDGPTVDGGDRLLKREHETLAEGLLHWSCAPVSS